MSSLEDYMLPCLNKKLLGLDCMGCGMQRSVNLILQAEFTQAFFMYPAIYTLILMLATIGINFFKNFKSANTIIFSLAILNAVIIISNFIYKTFLT
ncbi:DUF2752 domain-containing protein [Mariniflexile sp.]|uniref:DUF2752 domain-containing protein n=1 Tax=Mariniflexile sp. TaxID=1979402 RepID=UPI003565CDE4